MGDRQKLGVLIALIMLPLFSWGQKKAEFRFPLDTPAYLSGTFGEFRGSHFHAGIDIKTFGVEGLPVHAAADGYVSRIKISPYGYGKAIYITHFNGHTTVYGHLSRFSDEIENWIRRKQYARREYSIELFPDRSRFRLKKGQLIAYTGNTGGSSAPHLHFEIRDSRTQEILDPLNFELGIIDSVSPIIEEIRFVSRDRMKKVLNGKYPTALSIPVKNIDVEYGKIKAGIYGLVIAAKDFLNHDTSNTLGTHEVTVSLNGNTVYKRKFDRFSFRDAKYIHLLSDYDEGLPPLENCFKENWIQHKLSSYKGDGWLDLNGLKQAIILVEVKDEAGNKSSRLLSLEVDGIQDAVNVEHHQEDEKSRMVFNKAKSLKPKEGYIIDFFRRSFFDSIQVRAEVVPGNPFEELHLTPAQIVSDNRFRIIFPIPDDYGFDNDKLCIARINDGKASYVSTKLAGKQLSCKTKGFGVFTLVVDSIPPKIQEPKVYQGWLEVEVADDFSGIGKYNAYIGNKWFLMEYDPKTDLLRGDLSDFKSGEQLEFKLVVEDNTSNKSTLKTTIRKP